MKKLKKLFALAMIASVAFASCKKKATEDDLNALRNEVDKAKAEQQALADSLAAQQERDSLEEAKRQDGYIKGTFTGTREDNGQSVSIPFEFKYRFTGYDGFYNYDADDSPEYFDFYRYKSYNDNGDYLYFGFGMDLPGNFTPDFDDIDGRFSTTLADGSTFVYGFDWNSGDASPVFSNVSYSNGRLKADFSWSLPDGNGIGYNNNNAATINGSFDIATPLGSGYVYKTK
ncbi:MAG: hypothetical protein SFU27_00125 [Thermonemataceae bacterium]|nr:hypothetical protein [Thermonemataceae bacterium]